MPRVSVVIPSFQGALRLPGLLEALSSQIAAPAFEVVLVLDGSTDASAAVAHEFQDELNLVIIDRGFNAGRSVTLNDGFSAATGEVLIRCDDDLLPTPNYVARFAQWFETDVGVGVIGLYKNVYPDTPYAQKYGRPVDQRFRDEAYQVPQNRRWHYWAGNCAVHRSMWEQVGPYDHETFRTYGWEDVDWGYRLKAAGGRIVMDPELETPHRVAATTCAIRAERAQLSGAAARLFDAKYGTNSLPATRGLWGAAVRVTSASTSRRWALAIDKFLSGLPEEPARKLVDLEIQARFRRGYLSVE